MEKAKPFSSTKTIVDSLRQTSKDILASRLDAIVIPDFEAHGLENGKYPMGIKEGTYTKEELADALHFIADMLE